MKNKANFDNLSVTSNHSAIDELLQISQISDFVDRTSQIEKWINDWILEVGHKQTILNKRYLSLTNHDDLCEYVTSRCVQDFIDNDAAKFDIKSNSYAVKLTALRNKKNS